MSQSSSWKQRKGFVFLLSLLKQEKCFHKGQCRAARNSKDGGNGHPRDENFMDRIRMHVCPQHETGQSPLARFHCSLIQFTTSSWFGSLIQILLFWKLTSPRKLPSPLQSAVVFFSKLLAHNIAFQLVMNPVLTGDLLLMFSMVKYFLRLSSFPRSKNVLYSIPAVMFH